MNNPSKFSNWMRTNLKDAFSGLITQDIDFIIKRDDGHYLIAEEKNLKHARTGPAQAVIYKMLDEILSTDNLFLRCHKITVDNKKIYVNELQTIDIHDFLKDPTRIFFNDYDQSWFDKVLYFSLQYLWDGKGSPPKSKTEKERTYNRSSLLKPFLDGHKVDYESIDWIFVNYVTGYYILLSEFNNNLGPLGQRINKVFENNKNGELKVYNPKSKCNYKYLGHYNIKYSFDDFGEINQFAINNQKISVVEAINVLNLDDREIEKFK
ncbi:MAG: hypothetical protein ACOX5Y_04695 [Acholeplasmataceae bacterium]